MRLLKNENANVKMLGGVVALLIMLAVGILVAYTIVGSVWGDAATLDHTSFQGNNSRNATPMQNATNDTLAQMTTFFSVAPIIAIVIVAVVILGYVSRIGGG